MNVNGVTEAQVSSFAPGAGDLTQVREVFACRNRLQFQASRGFENHPVASIKAICIDCRRELERNIFPALARKLLPFVGAGSRAVRVCESCCRWNTWDVTDRDAGKRGP